MQLLKSMNYKCATLYGLDTETNEMNSGKPSPESNVAIQYWQRYFYDECNLARGQLQVELQSRMEERIPVDT